MTKDLLGQEVNIGDWVATIPKGYRSVVVGKITSFTKGGNPRIKDNIKSDEQNVGLTTETEYGKGPGFTHGYRQYMKPHFTKIIPTSLIDKAYEV